MSENKSQKGSKAAMDAINNAIKDKTIDQAFYVADLADIVFKCRYWKAKLPRVEPFYAIKCNSDPMVLRLMASLGVRFDCASKGEIDAVLAAGANPSDIIYAHPYKSNTFLRYASAINVDLMTFDSEQELLKIKNTYPQARLLLRIRVPEVAAAFPLSNKFGCDLKDTYKVLILAKQLNMNIIGTSFHVGSLCEEPAAFAKAIRLSREVFDTAELLGFHFTILDIGGGFPGATGTIDTFDEMCFFINQGLKEHFPENCGVRIIAEPGCYMVCSAYTLCTKILGKRLSKDSNPDNNDMEQKCFYYMNDGVYGSFAYGFEKYGFHVIPLVEDSQLRQRSVRRSKLWGTTCCSSDCILEDCLMPDMEVGEYIAFDNMGAYTQTLTTTFNGFAKPSSRYIFSSVVKDKPRKLPPFEDYCRGLGSNKLKAFVKIQEYICHDDSNDDLFRKG